MKNFAASFINLFKKEEPLDRKFGYHKNGADNNYPELIESLIANSVTANQCANLMATYISGKGFGDANKTIVNKHKGTTLLQLANDIAESFAYHKGVFIQVNWNLNYEITSADVLPFADCRVGKKDDNDYSGKILVCDDWSKAKADTVRVVDVFNPNKEVIQSQIDKAGSVQKYNGQIFYFKFGKRVYPYAPIHPCLEDADSERRAAIYKNTSLRKGFFGKTLIVTRPLVDGGLKESNIEEYRQQESERDAFKGTIQDFIGAENANGALLIEMEFEGDDIDKEILFKNIESNIDDKLFSFTEQSVSDNIRMCFNNVPATLIRSSDGSLFGAGGDNIREMKLFYQDQTNDERMMLEEIVGNLMGRFKDFPQQDLKIVPLIQEETNVIDRQAGNSEA